MTLEGKDECFRRLEQVTAAEFERAGDAFWDVCRGVILVESVNEAPIWHGDLRRSAQACSFCEREPESAVAHLGYGGSATPYALRIHEDLNIHHPIHIDPDTGKEYDCHGKAKFLEDPVVRLAPSVPELVKSRLDAMGSESP